MLEDLNSAFQQIHVECNSVTDNPLTTPDGVTLHGGNFQAKSVTSAMEKTRLGFQSLGRLLFVQCNELINPATNNGLPPNLTADAPSESFIMKGVDILCASYLSELGFLANTVSPHVQTAEMGNQALNSLALISARYTHTAADLLARLSAAHLFVLCQALDLRALHSAFISAVEPLFQDVTAQVFNGICIDCDLHSLLWPALLLALDNSTTQDPTPRFHSIVSSLQSTILPLVDANGSASAISLLRDWTHRVTTLLHTSHKASYVAYLEHGEASSLLGPAARDIYLFVRKELRVPFLHEKMLHASLPDTGDIGPEADYKREHVLTIGDHITVLHEAIRQGVLLIPVMKALKEARDAVNADVHERKHAEPMRGEATASRPGSEKDDVSVKPAVPDIASGVAVAVHDCTSADSVSSVEAALQGSLANGHEEKLQKTSGPEPLV